MIIDPPIKKRGRPLHKRCPYCGSDREVNSEGGLFDEKQAERNRIKAIIYDWIRSPEAEYSGVDDLKVREVVANQLVMLIEKP